MEKLANVAFVLNRGDIEDRVKVAAVVSYINSIDTLDSDEEKVAALNELEELLKEGGFLGWLAPKLTRWGGRLAGRTGVMGRFGNWLKGSGEKMFQKAWEPAGKGIAAGIGGATNRTTANLGTSRLFNWAAAHPTAAKLGLGATVAGGTILGGRIYGGMRANDAYKRGYGMATSQLSPMVSALYAPRGAMSLPNNMRA